MCSCFGQSKRLPSLSHCLHRCGRHGLFGLAALLATATAAWADPPPLTAAPVLRLVPGGPLIPASLLASERGLSIPVTSLAALTPAYGSPPTAVPSVASSANFGAIVPARYGADTRLPSFADPTCLGGAGCNTFTQSFAYTLSESSVTNIVQIGSGVTAIVRVAGTQLSSATAATSAAAQAQALTAAAIPSQPGRRLLPVVNAGGVTQSISDVTQRLLTGRDTYNATVSIFGPDITRIGNMGRCDRPFGTCEGGITFNLFDGTENFDVITFQDLYITNVTTRTITSSGTVFLDYNSAAMGFAHPAAQTVGFEISSRFLNRMLSPQAATALGDSGVSLFVEGTGQTGDLDGHGALASSSFGFTGLRGGLLAAVGEDLSLGAVIEGGHWGWTLNDQTLPEHLSGDSVRGGAFLNWMAGPWRVNLGAFVGSQQVRSIASSTLGGGASRAAYDADVYGLGGEAGYPVAVGDWTLTPLVGLSWLGWSSPAFTETGGVAPLTVAATSRDQIRTSMGLGLDQAFDISGMPLALGGFAKLFGIHGDSNSLISASDSGLSAPGSFAVAGPGSGSVGGEVGAHAALSITPGAAITLSWSSRLANHASDHAGQIGLRIGL